MYRSQFTFRIIVHLKYHFTCMCLNKIYINSALDIDCAYSCFVIQPGHCTMNHMAESRDYAD